MTLALPLRKTPAFNHGDQPLGSRLFNVRDANNNAVGCQLEEHEADAIVLACNLHPEFVAMLKMAREKIDVWVGAMHETINCDDDVDALEKIDALLAKVAAK